MNIFCWYAKIHKQWTHTQIRTYKYEVNNDCSIIKFLSSQSGGSSYEQQKNVSPINSRQYYLPSPPEERHSIPPDSSTVLPGLGPLAGAVTARLAHTNTQDTATHPTQFVTKTFDLVFTYPGKIHTNRKHRMPCVREAMLVYQAHRWWGNTNLKQFTTSYFHALHEPSFLISPFPPLPHGATAP